MHLFYTPLIQSHHTDFVLDETESKHAIRVLRLGKGSEVFLIDGRGIRYRAEILDPHPKRTVLTINEVVEEVGKRSYHFHLAVAPTKNVERIEWLLEKATEIGVDEITPLICEHSERKEVKTDRLNKIIVSAMKQSLKAYLPVLNEPIRFDSFMRDMEGRSGLTKCIAHCANGDKQYLSDVLVEGASCLLLIGPEGDFSTKEIELAVQAGYHPVSLGASRLRTETAALVGCMEVALVNR